MPLTKIKRGGLDTGITDNSDANALTFDSSENANFLGNVGVKQSSPSSDNSSTAFLHIGSSSTDLSGLILESDENKWEIRESGHLYFMDGTASRFMIKNDGNIGINDGNPGQLLSVTKAVAGEYITALLNSSSTGSGLLVRGGDTSSHHALSVQDYAGNWKFQVLGDGQVYHRGGNFHIWEDDTKLRIGAGEDLELWHDSNNSWISNKTGSLKIDNTSHGGDIGFYTQTSGGAGKTPLILGSDGNATFAGTVITPKVNTGANSPLGLGDDSDVIHIGYTDEIWTQSGTNSEVYLHINHRGYNHDAGQFRGLKIRNGKTADIVVFKGYSHYTTFQIYAV